MPEVRRRRATATKPTASRRRDRAAEIEEDDDLEDEDVDAAAAPVRRTKKAAAKKAAPAQRRRPAPPVEDDYEDEDEEEYEDEEDEDYEDEEDEAPPVTRRRPRPDPEEDEEEEDEDDEPAPPRRKAKAATKKAPARRRPPAEEPPARRRKASGTTKKAALPKGLHTGLDGAEEVNKGGGGNNLALGKDPSLIKVLETGPFVSFKQHWIPQGAGQGDRPYVCIEEDCPLCDNLGDSPSKTNIFNVLYFPPDGEPVNKTLRLAVKAYTAFKEQATPRGKDRPVFTRDFWAVNRSGKGQQSQTNFKPVKERDLEEDWPEIFESFDPADLPDIIAEAKDHLSTAKIVQTHTRKQLLDVAKYASGDDEIDDEDDE